VREVPKEKAKKNMDDLDDKGKDIAGKALKGLQEVAEEW
jgi:hypothetical protein